MVSKACRVGESGIAEPAEMASIWNIARVIRQHPASNARSESVKGSVLTGTQNALSRVQVPTGCRVTAMVQTRLHRPDEGTPLPRLLPAHFRPPLRADPLGRMAGVTDNAPTSAKQEFRCAVTCRLAHRMNTGTRKVNGRSSPRIPTRIAADRALPSDHADGDPDLTPSPLG